MNRLCRNSSVIVFAIAVFITASAVAETPGYGAIAYAVISTLKAQSSPRGGELGVLKGPDR